MSLEGSIFDQSQDAIPPEVLEMSAEGIRRRVQLIDSEIRVRFRHLFLQNDFEGTKRRISSIGDRKEQFSRKDSRKSRKGKLFCSFSILNNKEQVKLNSQLPYLVGNVVEVLDVIPDEEELEDGANVDLDSQRQVILCILFKAKVYNPGKMRRYQNFYATSTVDKTRFEACVCDLDDFSSCGWIGRSQYFKTIRFSRSEQRFVFDIGFFACGVRFKSESDGSG